MFLVNQKKSLARINVLGVLTRAQPQAHRFSTQALFKELRREFYPIDKKWIPSTIQNYFKSSLTLAVWYMSVYFDDGGRIQKKE